MLSKKHRINKVLFGEFFKKGKIFSSEFLYLKAVKLSTPVPLFAFVVSSKVSKKAVVRNKLKRRARSIVGKILPEIKNPFAVIFFFKKRAETMTFKELELEIIKTLKKAGVV